MPDSYSVTWITDSDADEHLTVVTALDARSAAKTVIEIEEMIHGHQNVLVTGIQKEKNND